MACAGNVGLCRRSEGIPAAAMTSLASAASPVGGGDRWPRCERWPGARSGTCHGASEMNRRDARRAGTLRGRGPRCAPVMEEPQRNGQRYSADAAGRAYPTRMCRQLRAKHGQALLSPSRSPTRVIARLRIRIRDETVLCRGAVSVATTEACMAWLQTANELCRWLEPAYGFRESRPETPWGRTLGISPSSSST